MSAASSRSVTRCLRKKSRSRDDLSDGLASLNFHAPHGCAIWLNNWHPYNVTHGFRHAAFTAIFESADSYHASENCRAPSITRYTVRLFPSGVLNKSEFRLNLGAQRGSAGSVVQKPGIEADLQLPVCLTRSRQFRSGQAPGTRATVFPFDHDDAFSCPVPPKL